METGKGTPEGLKYALNKGTAYLNIYLVADRTESIRLTDLKTNESQLFVNLKEVAKWVKDSTGDCSYTGLHWSYKNGKSYKKRFVMNKVYN